MLRLSTFDKTLHTSVALQLDRRPAGADWSAMAALCVLASIAR